MKVSVVISAFNEEKKIEDCLRSVKKIAHEIIFVDGSSTDLTRKIASGYTDQIFTKENNLMLNKNKNFGFSKVNSEWILSLDADERVSDELSDEILQLDESADFNGYFIPRKNMIFGKWIKNTGWYPDYQLRLFRRGTGAFRELHVHEMLEVEGPTAKLNENLIHMNYDNITHFLDKMIRVYTVSEAEAILEKGYKFDPSGFYKMPISEFVSRYFLQKGYRDGIHGLILSTLMAFYHFVVFLRLWEKNNYIDNIESKDLLSEGVKFTKKQFSFWDANEKLGYEKNILKKQIYKMKRKISSS